MTSKNRSFVTDQAGHILQKTENGKTQNYFYANDKPLGSSGALSAADFDYNYTPVSGQYPASVPGSYVVSTGDTLRGIALALFGDAQLWYLVADANGLKSDADLKVGQRLTIPNQVTNLHNSSETFKPYAPGQIIGDTTPTLPDPPPPSKGGGCGGVGMIIMVVVAIVATFFFGPGLLTAVLSNIAGQGISIAVGAQDKFSWKSVGMAALSWGVGQGVAQIPELGGTAPLDVAIRAGVSSVVTQGLAVAVGLQDRFSWSAVAAAGVSAGINQAIGQSQYGNDSHNGMPGQGSVDFGKELTRNLVVGVARQLVYGGKANWVDVVADSFGNALGNSLAYQSSTVSAGTQPVGGGGNGLTIRNGEGIQRPFFASDYDAPDYQSTNYSLADAENLPRLDTQIGDRYSYTVGKGDNLSGIAQANGLRLGDLLALNNLSDPNLIRVGQDLTIPARGLVPDAVSSRLESSFYRWNAQQQSIPVPVTASASYSGGVCTVANPYGLSQQQLMDRMNSPMEWVGRGTTPDTYTTSFDRALGSFEATFAGATRVAAGLGGGLTFLGTWAATGGDIDAATYVKEQTEQALSYRIRSAGGQAAADTFVTAIAPAVKWLGNLKQDTGDYYYNQYGSFAGALGYTAPDALLALLPVAPKAFRSFGGAIGEYAFTGPTAGSRAAQWGAINPASPRYQPGVVTFGDDLVSASGKWLEASRPTAIPLQVAQQLNGRSFNNFGELRSAVWDAIANSVELSAGFGRASLAQIREGNAPFAPSAYQTNRSNAGLRFNLHHVESIASGGKVYDLSNLQIVSPKVHYGLHYY